MSADAENPEPPAFPRWVVWVSVPAILLFLLAIATMILYPRRPPFDEVIRGYRPTVEAMNLTRQGVDAHVRGELAQAEALYRQALERDPNYERANYLLGAAQVNDIRPAEAAETLAEPYEVDGIDVWRLTLRGTALARLGQYEAAIAEFNAAIAKQPTHVAAIRNRALVKLRQGRLEEALADIELCMRTDPKWRFPYLTRSVIFAEMGRLEEASADLDVFLEAHPEWPGAQENRAKLDAMLGR